MENEKEIIKSLSNLLDMLPENLTEEEKKKLDEIRQTLDKDNKKIDE